MRAHAHAQVIVKIGVGQPAWQPGRPALAPLDHGGGGDVKAILVGKAALLRAVERGRRLVDDETLWLAGSGGWRLRGGGGIRQPLLLLAKDLLLQLLLVLRLQLLRRSVSRCDACGGGTVGFATR